MTLCPSTKHHTDKLYERVDRWTGWTLRFGVLLSATLMMAGLLAMLCSRTIPVEIEQPSFRSPLSLITHRPFDAYTLLSAGIMLLILTPFLRVLAATVGFFLERDRPFVVVSLIVFGLLMSELFYAFG